MDEEYPMVFPLIQPKSHHTKKDTECRVIYEFCPKTEGQRTDIRHIGQNTKKIMIGCLGNYVT